MVSASIGAIVAGLFSTIGWFFKKGEQERRDAADVAKIIYEETKEETEEEAEKKIGKLVTRYGTIFRKLKKEWKLKKEC